MYTYLIGWSEHKKYYYGVRYSKYSNPKDLWVSYFTSSKHVINFANKYGDPDVIQVRKVFDSRNSAIAWENKVLQRLRVVEDLRFLNATYNKAIEHPVDYDPSINLYEWNKNRKGKNDVQLYGEEKAKNKSLKVSKASRRAWKMGKMNSKKPEDTTNYKVSSLKRWQDQEFRNKAKSRKWINNGIKSKMILPEEIKQYLNSGWVLGRAGG
jgi:hypothetical protein